MTQDEIKAIYAELFVRGLIKNLHDEMKKLRPFISRRTIIASFDIQTYDEGNPLQQRVIDTAKNVLAFAQMEAA